MKRILLPVLLLVLVLCAAPASADKTPACLLLGSQQAAAHLVTHIYAYTDSWDGVNPSTCPDEGCLEYGHVHCYGVRVTLWDTPAKGKSTVPYYPFGSDAKIGPDTEFQLTDVVSYQNKYYANIRVLNEKGYVVNSGFVSADYIGCDCESYDTFEEIPEYDYVHPPFTLR